MEVVNVSKTVCGVTFEEWEQRPDHVYIGRWAWPTKKASKWANPYSVKKYGRDKCLELYESKVRQTPELWNALEELDGKVLGCWCKPDGCHGDVLVRLIEEKKK